ncbi:L-Aspartase-like protein [Aspergillus sergii]|uniref:Arginosuccinase n=1 Tax=Aspergillus sergii TaxID=1034303 RepID=A0A5N6WWY1_9EURO|nr:L-Aspartase-like protein [Aspergillus sergii]
MRNMPGQLPSSRGRLSKPISELLDKNYQKPVLEQEIEQFPFFCWIDQAHAVMLIEQEIIPREMGRHILTVLRDIETGGVKALEIDPKKGGLLFHIEAILKKRIGDRNAGALHIARSRIDQSATAVRLAAREGMLEVASRIVDFRESLIRIGEKHRDTPLMGYTHMQHSQPCNLGHYFLAFADRLADRFVAGEEIFTRVNQSPLGTVGLSGTSWPIDREMTARLLAFEGHVENSKRGRDVDYLVEIASWLAHTMSILDRLATDLHLWSSSEFGFVETDDAFCGTSSIFPQKKNPLGLEMIKRAAGQSVSWQGTALATFRGAGTGDHMMAVVPVSDMLKVTRDKLELFAGIVDTLHVKEERIRQVLDDSWSPSSNLADTLVRKCDLSFRQAHHIVGAFLNICEEEGIKKADVTPEILQHASDATEKIKVDIDIKTLVLALNSEEFIRTRVSRGSVGPREVDRLLAFSKRQLVEDCSALDQKLRLLLVAKEHLDQEVRIRTVNHVYSLCHRKGGRSSLSSRRDL